MVGSVSASAESRSHIRVFASSSPIETHSAMPSENQSGSIDNDPPDLLSMSRWKACTSSWPRM